MIIFIRRHYFIVIEDFNIHTTYFNNIKIIKNNNKAIVRKTMTQIENYIIPTKTLFHSDRGFQYTSHSFKQFIEKHQIIQSMSRVGRCIDNGPMENFWGIIKEEMYR